MIINHINESCKELDHWSDIHPKIDVIPNYENEAARN